uniref:RIIa domain-containing protein n=1 Tax=Glossina pallidipes TaxID=7398 RepID=A0A1A9ZE04_GLOPL
MCIETFIDLLDIDFLNKHPKHFESNLSSIFALAWRLLMKSYFLVANSLDILSLRSPSDAMPNESKRIQVPDELREVLLEFSISFLLEQPPDVVDFAVDYFTKLQADRKLASGKQEGNGEEPKGDSLEEEEEDEVLHVKVPVTRREKERNSRLKYSLDSALKLDYALKD